MKSSVFPFDGYGHEIDILRINRGIEVHRCFVTRSSDASRVREMLLRRKVLFSERYTVTSYDNGSPVCEYLFVVETAESV